MSRLIDADALIADLKHDIEIDQDCLDHEELTDINRKHIQYDKDCKQNAIDFVTHTPTIEERKTGKWIPCSERLPENDCQCIVTAKVKHVDNYPDYEVDTADYTDGIFTTANSWWGIESIIAWMPLPEPYTERREE